jgi:hypothetical protein
MVTKDNFHLSTKAIWKRLKYGEQAFLLADELKKLLPFIKPFNSTSTYMIDEKNDQVYRLSDHWGPVGTCGWWLDNPLPRWVPFRTYVIAVAKFSDFKQKKIKLSCQTEVLNQQFLFSP